MAELTTSVRRVNLWSQAARYEPMVDMLPGLLAELHTAAHFAKPDQAPHAWALLAATARCGHSVGIALHSNDLSIAALQRMDWAAAQSGDHAPGWQGVREYLRITAHMRDRDYAACHRLHAAGLARLDGADKDTPGALVARGQLHLGAAIIAAHTGDRDTMAHHLDTAETIASTTGEQPEQFWLGFGPTNVRVHRVMALGAIGDHARAISAAAGLRFPSRWLPTRIGHHYLDVARAYRWLNQPDKALAALHAAREAAPGQARRHPLTHDTVAALLHTPLARSDELTRYAAWIGI